MVYWPPPLYLPILPQIITNPFFALAELTAANFLGESSNMCNICPLGRCHPVNSSVLSNL